MVIDLIGVLEDGSGPRAAWVPFDTRAPMRLTAGETVTIRLRVVTPTGAPVVLAEGETIVLAARSSTQRPSRALVTRSATVDRPRGLGYYLIAIPGTDTRYLGGASGVVDVWLRRESGNAQIVGLATFSIAPTAVLPTSEAAAPVPNAAAAQDGTERSFPWTATVAGTVQTVAIPGLGMRDATYSIVAFNLRDPAPGDGAHPDARYPGAGRTTTSFQVVTDAPIRAGSVFDVVLRDAAS